MSHNPGRVLVVGRREGRALSRLGPPLCRADAGRRGRYGHRRRGGRGQVQHSVFTKLKLSNRTQLSLLARERGWI